MEESKTFASLSPSLLARKGSAKPAMRPQLQPLAQFHENVARQMDVAPEIAEDLGWNDHGEEDGTSGAHVPEQYASAPARIVPINGRAPTQTPVSVRSVPEVVRQQDTIEERMTSDAPAEDRASRRSALSRGGRAAFTLRLDAERHLKLRLACAVDNRSAQQIVTEALDRLIGEMPEIDALARQVRRGNAQKGDLT